MTQSKKSAKESYANNLAEYHLGMRWMRVAVPIALTKGEAAYVRRKTYAWLRKEFPQRFPKSFRFR